jgi:hypothetical protein
MSDFDKFQSEFPMDYSPLQNYLQYNVANREIYYNWCKTFCTPVIYRKLTKEGVNLDPSGKTITDFSRVDKYVIAFGNQKVNIDNNDQAYTDFDCYLPIQPESYSKLNAQFTDTLDINAPYDPRFEYKVGDVVLFRFNEFLFRFEVAEEPMSYMGILYQLSLKYVDKKSVLDLHKITTEDNRGTIESTTNIFDEIFDEDTESEELVPPPSEPEVDFEEFW